MAQQIAAAADNVMELVCPACGYDLRAIASKRCSECGQAVDRQSMSMSRIPWAHRKTIGRWRAYWRTNLMVIFHPGRMADEIARPISFADAQRFRQLTILAEWLMVAVSGASLLTSRGRTFSALREPSNLLGWWLEAGVFVAAQFASWLALLMMSGVGSYFFHPRYLSIVRQNRGVALSYYTCAPLAWLWLPAVCAALSTALLPSDWVQNGPGEGWVNAIDLAAAALGAAIVLVWWFGTVRLMARVTRCGPARTIFMAIYLPLAWAVCAAVASLIPAACFACR